MVFGGPSVTMVCARRSTFSPGAQGNGKRQRLTQEGNLTVQGHIDVICEALRSAPRRSEASRQLFVAQVTSSLGVALDERDAYQEFAVETCASELKAISEVLQSKAVKREKMIYDLDGMQAALEKELVQLRASVENADGGVKATEAAAQAAKVERQRCQAEVQAAVDAKKQVDDEHQQMTAELGVYRATYREHFLPLRDGTDAGAQEVQKHHNALLPLFQVFGFEKSLLGAFGFAVQESLGSRREFDITIFSAVDTGFLKQMTDLEGRIKGKEPGLASASKLLAKAEKALVAARAAERTAASKLGKARAAFALQITDPEFVELEGLAKACPMTPATARELMVAAQADLKRFADGPEASFAFLKERIAALEEV